MSDSGKLTSEIVYKSDLPSISKSKIELFSTNFEFKICFFTLQLHK